MAMIDRRDFVRENMDSMSMSQMAQRLRTSRSAVAGIKHRLKNPDRRPRPARVRFYKYKLSVDIDAGMNASVVAYMERHGLTRSVAVRELLEWALMEFGDE